MKDEHTPGPWHHVNDFDVWDAARHPAQSIARCDPSGVGNTEAMNNARLIAAAPLLLAALKKAAFVMKESGFVSPLTEEAFDDALASAINAIESAEGRG